ncbi:hypothetical protein TREES_T100006109 [Tupaia chinensis]|uniref:Uncharacterized protein n=1 Tax=Tupaia chinensis TaxID=246437 RepID=L9LDC3_TUPCH|nr:hypothetical protein TREES_T100006109 [Tupaia chinensis]
MPCTALIRDVTEQQQRPFSGHRARAPEQPSEPQAPGRNTAMSFTAEYAASQGPSQWHSAGSSGAPGRALEDAVCTELGQRRFPRQYPLGLLLVGSVQVATLGLEDGIPKGRSRRWKPREAGHCRSAAGDVGDVTVGRVAVRVLHLSHAAVR